MEPGRTGLDLGARQKRGAHTGPNPTDKGKSGSKRHVVVDAHGIPLAVTLTAANVHDSQELEPALEAIEPIRRPHGRPRKRPGKLHADKAYDAKRCRLACRRRGIIPRIARRGIASSTRLGRYRWVVERTFAWLGRYRRLSKDYEALPATEEAWIYLAMSSLMLARLAK